MSDVGRSAFRFQLVGERFELVAPSGDVLAALRDRLPPLTSCAGAEKVCRRYVVEKPERASPELRVRRGTGKPRPAAGADGAADVIAEDIQHLLAHRAGGLLFLHAGAVVWRGRAILLPGRSGCGKSSLVAALLDAGAGYLSDELALVDARGRAHSYARPLALRRGGTVERLAAARLGASVAESGAPVAVLAFLSYAPGAAWSVERLTPGRAVLAGLRHALAARRRLDLARRVLIPLSRRAVAVSGRRGEAAAAVRHLLEAAGGG